VRRRKDLRPAKAGAPRAPALPRHAIRRYRLFLEEAGRTRSLTILHTTFSIVARDPASGQLGVAIASRPMCVGSLCPAIRAGVGAAVTQAWTNPMIPSRLFPRLETGTAPEAALALTMAEEVDAGLRQVAVVDVHGRSAAFTGSATTPAAGHRTADQVSVQGNMLAAEEVLDRMLETFLSAKESFAGRLLGAMAAGAMAGGDARGERSAALRIVEDEDYPLVDLRVDDHDRPLEELGRLWRVFERDMLAYRRAQPTRANPRGRFDDVRAALLPPNEEGRGR
jgi:uncharacterized Ntn-hydrolase superfamily protein